MTVVMALDQGTSSSRAMIFDDRGRVLGSGQEPFDQIFPRDGWVEQDPDVLWQTSLRAGRTALQAAGLSARELAAIGITNQRETTLAWDADSGAVLYNAIGWQDRRTADQAARIKADGMATTIQARTGLVADPYFSSTKMAWLLSQVPAVREAAERGTLRFGTVDCYLIWRLTGGQRHVTDATNASRTQLFRLAEQSWDPELLDYFGIPASSLPEVLDSAANFGTSEARWFGAGVPILGVAGDQHAALIGQACFEPGMTKSTYGTGCFLMSNTGQDILRSEHGLLSTMAYRIDGRPTYALEGSIFNAGVAVKWLRDKLGLIATARASEDCAERVGGDAGGVFVVPGFTGLGAPHWRPDARGLVCGLTLDTGADHVVTAVLQSVAFQTQDLLAALKADGGQVSGLRIDGGMVENNWLCQFLADVAEVPVERPLVTETTVLGAALLALLGTGAFSSLDDSTRLWQLQRRFEPVMPDQRRAALLDGWNQAVARACLNTG